MDQDELLRLVVERLDRLQIPYFVTDSVATIFFGEPHFTNDIDLVIALSEETMGELVREFPAAEFYLSDDAARAAVAKHNQFNLIHPRSGLKVDFMVADETPYNRSRFDRAVRVDLAPDFQASFASPEDVILMKMVYYREGRSDKHLRDILGVLKISGDKLDLSYLREWSVRMELESVWEMVSPGSGA